VRRDRARTKILRTSPFGLIEMTRQRIRPSLRSSFYRHCPACNGTGSVKTAESMALEVIRRLTKERARSACRRTEFIPFYVGGTSLFGELNDFRSTWMTARGRKPSVCVTRLAASVAQPTGLGRKNGSLDDTAGHTLCLVVTNAPSALIPRAGSLLRLARPLLIATIGPSNLRDPP
jgi:hypothetical protein